MLPFCQVCLFESHTRCLLIAADSADYFSWLVVIIVLIGFKTLQTILISNQQTLECQYKSSSCQTEGNKDVMIIQSNNITVIDEQESNLYMSINVIRTFLVNSSCPQSLFKHFMETSLMTGQLTAKSLHTNSPRAPCMTT